MLHNDALAMTFKRNAFYKERFQLILAFFLLSLLGIGVLIYILVYLLIHPPRPIYFVANAVGALVQDAPVAEPNMSVEEVASWVVSGIEAAYTYSYANYRAELQNAQKILLNMVGGST